MYDEFVAKNKQGFGFRSFLYQDDGSLVREFGDPQPKASESKPLKEVKKHGK